MARRTVLATSWPLFFGVCNAFFSVDRTGTLLKHRTFSFDATNVNRLLLVPINTLSSSSSSPDSRLTAVINEDLTDEEVKTFYSPNVPLDDSTERTTRTRGDNNDDASHEYSFFDEAMITVRAGSGGQGASTYRKGVGSQDGPPDGGNGGKGGNVIFRLDAALNTLAGLSQAWRPNSFGGSGAATPQRKLLPKNFRAENGQPGDRQHRSGGNGNDVLVRLPPGTVIQEKIENSQGSFDYIDIATINEATPEIIVARGGEGGEGTAVVFKSGRGVKRPRTAAQGGQKKVIKLTLKIVADVALVGVPNAGKSTFLAAVTRYAFVDSLKTVCAHRLLQCQAKDCQLSLHNNHSEPGCLDSRTKR
jgi:GTP1/OBG